MGFTMVYYNITFSLFHVPSTSRRNMSSTSTKRFYIFTLCQAPGIYLNNCPQGLHGPIEIFSQAAFSTFFWQLERHFGESLATIVVVKRIWYGTRGLLNLRILWIMLRNQMDNSVKFSYISRFRQIVAFAHVLLNLPGILLETSGLVSNTRVLSGTFTQKATSFELQNAKRSPSPAAIWCPNVDLKKPETTPGGPPERRGAEQTFGLDSGKPSMAWNF